MEQLKIIADQLINDPNWSRTIRKPEYQQFKKDVTSVTSFLPITAKMAERLYIISNNITKRPLCTQCNINECNWDMDKKQYRTFCSSKCVQQNDHVKGKRASTNIQKFGCDNPFKNESVREQCKTTMIDRYGTHIPILSTEIKQKIINTNKRKYGVEYNCTSENNTAKRKITNEERYGVEFPFQSNSVQDQVKHSILDKYGVTSTALIPEIKQRQLSSSTLTYNDKYPFFNIIRDKSYVESQYVDQKLTQSEIAKKIGCSQETVSHHMKGHNIPTIARFTSSIENEIFDYVSSIYEGQIIRNDRSTISPKELDIIIPELKVAIEVNGVFWHSELQGKSKNYHLDKSNMCKNVGYQLIHVTDVEWLTQRDIVKSRLQSKLKCTTDVYYARKLSIVDVSKRDSDVFFNKNHIQGSCNSSIRYGLVDDTGKLLCVMAFGACRFSDTYNYELIRFAVTLGTSVVGGASKLFQHFIRNNQGSSIVSYCDTSWNTGNVYKQLGFEYSHKADPNYKYFHTRDCTKLYNRMKFQKHRLESQLPIFDPQLTEWQNMQNNGFNRIWDCGNTVWVYHIK